MVRLGLFVIYGFTQLTENIEAETVGLVEVELITPYGLFAGSDERYQLVHFVKEVSKDIILGVYD